MEYGFGLDSNKSSISIIKEWEDLFNRNLIKWEQKENGQYVLYYSIHETLNKDEMQYLFDRFTLVTVGVEYGYSFISLIR